MTSTDKKVPSVESQAASEAQFFDRFYTDVDQRHALQGYIVPDRFINQTRAPNPRSLDAEEYSLSRLGNLSGKSLLDYGAGDGWRTVCFAKANASVCAMDISQKAVDLIKKKAHANSVSDRVEADVRNCYATDYSPSQFDRIYGGGILHHLDITQVGPEIARILRPDGIAIFHEPIRETKIMDVIKAIVLAVTRRKSDEETTENEAPLTAARLAPLRQHFDVVDLRYFNVLSSASLLFDSERLKSLLLRADDFLFRIVPGFRRLGRAVVIELREPRNAASPIDSKC